MSVSQWCDLPEDLLVLLAKRFDSRVDTNKFRGVCCSWRFSVPPPPPIQFPIFTFWLREGVRLARYVLQLLETTVFSLEEIATGKRMLIRVRETGQDSRVEIKDPFGRSIQEFRGKVINLFNFRVSEITKLYHLHDITPRDEYICERYGVPLCNKVPVTAPLGLNNYCPILALSCGKFRDDGYFDSVAGCLIYNGTLTNFHHSSKVVQHKGKLYVSNDRWGFVQVYDYSHVLAATINIPGSESDFRFELGIPRSRYYYFLVCFGGDLFLVKKLKVTACECIDDMNETEGDNNKKYIQVYKLVDKDNVWVEVRELGERALILCVDRSFDVSVQDFAGIQKGVIYFLDCTHSCFCDTEQELEAFEEPKDCVWAFSLEKGTLWRVPHDGLGLFY